MKRSILIIFFSLLLLLLSACQGQEEHTVEEHIEADLDSSETFQILKTKAMQTARAELTLVSILEPTNTPAPPEFPIEPTAPNETQNGVTAEEITAQPETPAEEIHNTPIPLAATFTPIPGNNEYNCTVRLISPAEGQVYAAGEDFDAHWQLSNTGTNLWDHNSTDLFYIGGEKIHRSGDIVDTYVDVQPGETINIFIPMTAPIQPGFYQSGWVLKRGTLNYCSMNLIIEVFANH